MRNIKLTISYDGSRYFGSQIQPNKITIQSKLTKVLEQLNIDTTLQFSGRTDKGVHAFRQVVSCFIPSYWNDLKKLQTILNKMLPNDIFVRSIYFVKDDFHARFSAKKREYRYIISQKPLTPFNSKYLAYYNNFDIKKIFEVIKLLQGEYDFKYFSKTGSEPKSTIRIIYNIRFYQYKGYYIFQFIANSYLRSQIRMMVDFILKIAQNRLTINDLQLQLECKKRVSYTLAPSNGLYLSKVIYK